MTQKEILEGNVLIAVFMGAQKAPMLFGEDRLQMNGDPFPSRMWTCAISELEYSTSWDWLMPVVKSIMYITPVQGMAISLINNRESIIDTFEYVDILKTWKSVTKFINWYNTNKPKQP